MAKIVYYVGLIALVASVFATRPAKGQEFVVVNKCTTTYTVVNKCVAPTKSVATTTVSTTRQPVGHTHTCANGHTWDHSITSSHNCPTCGLFQNQQDVFPRPVTTAPQSSVFASPFASPIQVSGGCANGRCEVVSSPSLAPQNEGWYLGKNIGRKR